MSVMKPAGEAFLEMARAHGDPLWIGRALFNVGAECWWTGDPGAEELLEAGRAASIAAGDERGVRCAAYGLGVTAFYRERYDVAKPMFERLVASVRREGSPEEVSEHLLVRAMIEVHLGNFATARQLSDEMSAIYRHLSELSANCLALIVHALADIAEGRDGPSRAALEEMWPRYVRDGELRWIPWIVAVLARFDILDGRARRARRRAINIWDYPAAMDSPIYRIMYGEVLGLATWLEGDHHTARNYFENAVADATAYGNRRAVALADAYLAGMAREEGEHLAARSRLQRSLDEFAAMGFEPDVAAMLQELAGLDVDSGNSVAAARLFGAASAINERLGIVHRLGRQAVYDGDIGRAMAALGPGAWSEAQAAGALLSTDEAVAFAQRMRGERERPLLGWDSLTATEAQVVGLASQGLTNPAIAERLLMGRETVKTHLSNVYRKLGIRNRTELAGALAQRHGQNGRSDRQNGRSDRQNGRSDRHGRSDRRTR
jgi:ATP/maltotriose-dependent transcriptional regulator MalT